MDPRPNEYELARRARDGDQDALAELVERTRTRLFALAYAELRDYDDAQDAVASALLQICRHVGDLRAPERSRAWMQSIVRNEVRRLQRAPKVSAVGEEEADRIGLPDAERAGVSDAYSLLRLDIERALRRLPLEQAGALRLFYLEETPIREIARITGRSEGTIKSWLHRGRRHLANEMEGYAPMPPATNAPAQSAAIVHTDLDPALIRQLTESLAAIGYQATIITGDDLSHLLAAFKEGESAVIEEWLQRYPVILLDEWIGGRSAFEFLINAVYYLQARSGSAGTHDRSTALYLLCNDPSDFTVLAAWNSGAVHRVIDKSRPGDLTGVTRPVGSGWVQYPGSKILHPAAGGWQRFTERARRVVSFAQEEAARVRDALVSPEHLLLGLMREEDHVAARILGQLGIPLEQIRSGVRARLPRGPGETGEMKLAPQAKEAIDLAYGEAGRLGNNYLGSEHLLLGLIREGKSPAAQVLVNAGADLERTRKEVEKIQSE